MTDPPLRTTTTPLRSPRPTPSTLARNPDTAPAPASPGATTPGPPPRPTPPIFTITTGPARSTTTTPSPSPRPAVRPVTERVAQLRDTFAELGIRPDTPLLVHSSLRGTGVAPSLVRDALLDALGSGGTLVVPAFTPENSDSSRAYLAATEGLTEREKAGFRAAMPPFVPDSTPCRSMGALAESVRTTPGAVRSGHPQTSFAGLGPRAAELLGRHDPACHLGEDSPLAALYAADAQILLLRVGFEVCSAFHLAEYRTTPPAPRRTYRCVVSERGNWISYEDLVLDDSDFGLMGKRLPRELVVRREWAGKTVTLCAMRAVVDHAVDQMAGYRSGMT